MFKQGNSCVGCATVFLGFIVIMTLLRLITSYAWFFIIAAAVVAVVYWARKKKGYNYETPPPAPKQREPVVRENAEKIVLRIAAQNQGLVTPMEIAIASDLSMDEASRILEDMRKKGYASLRVADNGSYVYEIEGLLSMQQKKDSERL